MKYFLLFLLLLGVIAGIIYSVPPIRTQAANDLSYSPCDSPEQYKLGSIDSRFGLSNAQVQTDIQDATGIWDSLLGKNLFTYSSNAALTVNFVYDSRQALNSSISQLNSQLSQNNKSLSEQVAQFKSDYAAFKQKLDALNATIEKYNKQGGAPPDVYNNLTSQQQELNKEGDALNTRAQQLNLSTSDYNYNVSVLNNDVNQYNAQLTTKPEEGFYNGQDNTITIYLINGRNELVHTLAHEFGHSLGMEHVKDPQAIMYTYTSDSTSPTAEDIAQLNYVCRKQSIIVYDIQQLDLWVATEIQALQKSFVKQ